MPFTTVAAQPQQCPVFGRKGEFHLIENLPTQAVQPTHRDVEESVAGGALQVRVLGMLRVPARRCGEVVDGGTTGHVGVRDDAERDQGLQAAVDSRAVHARLTDIDLCSDSFCVEVATAGVEHFQYRTPRWGDPLTGIAKLLHRALDSGRFANHGVPRFIRAPMAARSLEEILA